MCPLPKAAAPIATSPGKVYDLTHYLKGALAGGICCSITHGALCPVAVVKTGTVITRACTVGRGAG
jgi:hypothetical protein